MIKRVSDHGSSPQPAFPWVLAYAMILAMIVFGWCSGCTSALPLHSHDDKPTEVNVNLPKAAKGDVEAITDRLASSDNWPLWIACMVILAGAAWLSWRRWSKTNPARFDDSRPTPTS